MSAISWVLIAVGTWSAIIAVMQVCAAGIKRTDRMQSELLSAARRARFVNPQPRRTQFGG